MKTTNKLGKTHHPSQLLTRTRWLGLVSGILTAVLFGLFGEPTRAAGWSIAHFNKTQIRRTEPRRVPCGRGEFAQYGFNASGFSKAQEGIILQAISSYASALGGAEQLKKVLAIYNGIPCQEIFYDPNGAGAFSDIRLTSTVFDMELALKTNYSHYYASTEQAHARIVIGHEIGHLLSYSARGASGVDWIRMYRDRVQRDWQTSASLGAYEEEAVTQLSLEVQGMGYFYSILVDGVETDPQRKAEIRSWVADFLGFLQGL